MRKKIEYERIRIVLVIPNGKNNNKKNCKHNGDIGVWSLRGVSKRFPIVYHQSHGNDCNGSLFRFVLIYFFFPNAERVLTVPVWHAFMRSSNSRST